VNSKEWKVLYQSADLPLPEAPWIRASQSRGSFRTFS